MINKNTIKMFVGVNVPIYSCNFRCSYCYLGHHDGAYRGKIGRFGDKIEKFVEIFDPDLIKGYCYFNFCGFGETLLHPDVVELVKRLLKQGHYVDIITNGTVSNQLKILREDLNDEEKSRLIIKFSFHYLELKEKGLLDSFADNVNRVRESGISISVEITPHDELIEFIPEIKEFSLLHFKALPHVTVARDETSRDIKLLSKYTKEELLEIWGNEFDSDMFRYKLRVFGEKRKEFCYAGSWSIQVDPSTGCYGQCYIGNIIGNIYKDNIIKTCPIGRCREPHCFNAHAFLTFGVIPQIESPDYLSMRDRIDSEGNHWVNQNAVDFLTSKLGDSNVELSDREKYMVKYKNLVLYMRNILSRIVSNTRAINQEKK